MSEIKDSLKKIVMAGFGAVSTGLEKSQEMLDQLAEKGKDSYEQAAQATRGAVEKLKQAFEAGDIGLQKEDILTVMAGMPLDALKDIREGLDSLICDLEKAAQEAEETREAEEAACEADAPCGGETAAEEAPQENGDKPEPPCCGSAQA